jgi:hypothetical protein
VAGPGTYFGIEGPVKAWELNERLDLGGEQEQLRPGREKQRLSDADLEAPVAVS